MPKVMYFPAYMIRSCIPYICAYPVRNSQKYVSQAFPDVSQSCITIVKYYLVSEGNVNGRCSYTYARRCRARSFFRVLSIDFPTA